MPLYFYIPPVLRSTFLSLFRDPSHFSSTFPYPSPDFTRISSLLFFPFPFPRPSATRPPLLIASRVISRKIGETIERGACNSSRRTSAAFHEAAEKHRSDRSDSRTLRCSAAGFPRNLLFASPVNLIAFRSETPAQPAGNEWKRRDSPFISRLAAGSQLLRVSSSVMAPATVHRETVKPNIPFWN